MMRVGLLMGLLFCSLPCLGVHAEAVSVDASGNVESQSTGGDKSAAGKKRKTQAHPGSPQLLHLSMLSLRFPHSWLSLCPSGAVLTPRFPA